MKSASMTAERAVRTACVLLLAATVFVTVGCLAGTVPAPVQPGGEALPAGSLKARESLALAQLSMLNKAEDAHMAMNGKYGTVPELMKAGLLNQPLNDTRTYTIDVTVVDDGAGYTAIAVPVEYGPTGRQSFFMDQTGTIRGADHEGGAPKTDDPIVTPEGY